MLKTRKRQTAPAPTAQDVHAEVAQERRDLTQRIESLESYITLDNLKSRKERESDRLAHLRQKAAPFARMRQKKALALLETAQDDLEANLPKFTETAEAAQRARQRVLRERAKELQPAHRGAVARIADALEKLAEALAEEADIRRECQTPDGDVPAVLPEMGFANIALPRDHTSPVSRWFKRARRGGFIKD